MSESRDRLPRPVGYEAIFVGWRVVGARFFILEDPKTSQNFTTPATRGGWFKSNGFGKPRSVGRRVRSRSLATGKENALIFSRGLVRDRPRRSVLPSWYLRVPLQDITWVMRAIERRRARLGDVEGLQIESLVPKGQRILDSSTLVSGAQPEHYLSLDGEIDHHLMIFGTPEVDVDISHDFTT